MPDDTQIQENENVVMHSGFYSDLKNNPRYRLKKKADEVSYIWDKLIESFSTHLLEGTLLTQDPAELDISQHEETLRYMALVPRHDRRLMGRGIHEALGLGRHVTRFTRGFLPVSESIPSGTGFLFLTLAVQDPPFEYEPMLRDDYEKYRLLRRSLLHVQALSFLQKNPKLERVVGVATEPPMENWRDSYSSQDLVLVEAPDLIDELLEKLEKAREALGIGQGRNYIESVVQDHEFPKLHRFKTKKMIGSSRNRRQRRAEREQNRKPKKAREILNLEDGDRNGD